MFEAELGIALHVLSFIMSLMAVAFVVMFVVGVLLMLYYGTLVGVGYPYKRWMCRKRDLEVQDTRLALSAVLDASVAVVVMPLALKSEFFFCCAVDSWWFKITFAVLLTLGVTTLINERYLFGHAPEKYRAYMRKLSFKLVLGPQLIFWTLVAPGFYLLGKHVLVPGALEAWDFLVKQGQALG